MAVRYAFDLYPREDPVNGAKLFRFTGLQQASYRGEANGTGSGKIVLSAAHDDAGLIDPLGMDYIRVVRIDDDTIDGGTDSGFDELVVGGFFLESGDFEALTEQNTRTITLEGAGTLSYLSRAIMANQSYLTVPFIGSDPYTDLWRLYAAGTGNKLGAILWRVITELQENGRPRDPIPGVVMTFDYTDDTNATPWARASGDFTAAVGENVLDVVARLMHLGLYVEMDPDTFELNAYEPGTHQRDQTGVAWGAGVVRFQSPTDTTIDTANIISDARRNLAALVKRTAILVGSEDSYEWVTQAGDVIWEGGFFFEGTDDRTEAGTEQLNARDDAGDTVRLKAKLGIDEADGLYTPFELARPDDLVTIHGSTTGAAFDWNEATYPISAATVSLREGSDWDVWYDLGDNFASPASRAFQAGGGGGSCACLRLCVDERVCEVFTAGG